MKNIIKCREAMVEANRLLEKSKLLSSSVETMCVEIVKELGLPPEPPRNNNVGALHVPTAPKFKHGPWSADVFVTLYRYQEHGLAVGQLFQLWDTAFDGWVVVELANEK